MDSPKSTLPPHIAERMQKFAALKALATSTPEPATEVDELTSARFTPSTDMLALQGLDAQSFCSRLQLLEAGIKARAPGIINYLRDINKELVKYPELTYILDDEKQAIITKGLLQLTNTEMAKISTKSTKRGTLSKQEAESLF